MKAEDKKININVPEGTKELVIRQNNPAIVKEPLHIQFDGVLLAPGDFMENRAQLLDPTKCHAVINRTSGAIYFVVDERSAYRDVVKGILKKSSVIEMFGINKDELFYTDKNLAKFFRRAQYYFRDLDVHGKIVNTLMNFQATVNTIIESSKDGRGNVKQLIEKKVNSDVPTSFYLKCPIYEGYPELEFEVLLCSEADSHSVKFYLESPALFNLLEEYKSSLIEKEVERFKKFGCAILFQ